MSAKINNSLESKLETKELDENALEQKTSGGDRDTKVSNFNCQSYLEAKIDKLKQILIQHSKQKQLIAIQDFPDPDALSSAWAYQLIAKQYQIKTDIVYSGTISHQENITLMKLTGLPATRWDSQDIETQDLSSYQGCVLVDTQGTNSDIMKSIERAKIPIVAIIDHHSKQGEIATEFIDLRGQIRATATMMTQYIQGGLLNFDKNDNKHVKCATALMHGLRSDTNQLLQAGEAEFQAAAYLSKFYDSQLLKEIMGSARSRQVMDIIEASLKNRMTQNNFSISGVGYLRYEDRDAIPQAADFLVTEENIHTAVVYGIIYDRNEEIELVVGSLRTNKITLDPDEFIKQALGQDPQGKYFGGGRYMAGGFEIPIDFLKGYNDTPEYIKLKWEVFDTQIKQKLLRSIDPDNKVV